MKLNIKNFSRNLKGLATGETVGISFSALWYGILIACLVWIGLVGIGAIILIAFTNETIYAVEGLLKLVTWSLFFIAGCIAGYKAGFKGWQHGMWSGVFLGLLSVIFLLEVVPTLIIWQQVLFQWFAATILGAAGGIVGLRYLLYSRDRKGYSFREAKKERFRQLDRNS